MHRLSYGELYFDKQINFSLILVKPFLYIRVSQYLNLLLMKSRLNLNFKLTWRCPMSVVNDNVEKQAVEVLEITPSKPVNDTVADTAIENKAEDPNWKAFREARKKDRLEREAAEKKAYEKEQEIAALKAAMEAAFAKDNRPVSQSRDEYSEETEDERIEKKVAAALALREKQYEMQQQQREIEEYPKRLERTYPDFSQTISSENLDYLDYHYPEVTGPIKRLPDGEQKWADIYRAVKKFVPNNATAKKDSAQAVTNGLKPKSMSSTSITQPGEAMSSQRLTDEKRAANWERMQKTLKGLT